MVDLQVSETHLAPRHRLDKSLACEYRLMLFDAKLLRFEGDRRKANMVRSQINKDFRRDLQSWAS